MHRHARFFFFQRSTTDTGEIRTNVTNQLTDDKQFQTLKLKKKKKNLIVIRRCHGNGWIPLDSLKTRSVKATQLAPVFKNNVHFLHLFFFPKLSSLLAQGRFIARGESLVKHFVLRKVVHFPQDIDENFEIASS